jgi:hypothetical protein
MAPGMRQDVGQLTGMNPEMMRLLYERGQVQGGLPIRGFAGGGYTGNGDPNEIAGVVHKGEYVFSHEALAALKAGGSVGTTAPAGPFMDAADKLAGMDPAYAHAMGLNPSPAPGLKVVPRPFSAGGTSFARAAALLRPGLWSRVGAWAANPASWLGMAKGLGMGAAGQLLTAGLEWGGQKVGVGSSDRLGGAFYHLGADAAGGALMGARGGPLGAFVGADAGMIAGDAMRLYHGVRDLNSVTFGAKWHKEVDVAQDALLRREPRTGEAFEAAMAARRTAAEKEKHRFDAWDRSAGARYSVESAMDAVQMQRADRLHARWEALKHQPLHPQAPVDSHHGWRGHGTEPRPGYPTTVHRMIGQPHPVTATARAAAAAHPGNVTATGGAAAPAATPPTNDANVRSAAAAMDALTTSSGRLQAAFESLAGVVSRLSQNNNGGGNGGNGLQFQPAGQQGGWYAGRSH